jgi:putative transposase
MSRVSKTIRQRLDYRAELAGWFEETQVLFNRVAAFYFDVIEAYPEVLDMEGNGPRDTLERLTHRTKTNPDPVTPLAAVADNLPALVRRALARGEKFKKRPPAPPGRWNKSVTFYAGMWKERTGAGILLKLWTGKSCLKVGKQ